MRSKERLDALAAEARQDGFLEIIMEDQPQKGRQHVLGVAFRTATAERVRIVRLAIDINTGEVIKEEQHEGVTAQECKHLIASLGIRPGDEWALLS